MKLTTEQIDQHLATLANGWKLNGHGHLYKEFTFDNFLDPLAFANKVAPIAEEMQHHPDLTISWGKFSVEIWTHDQNGITEKDFKLANQIEAI
ncbi:MAG: 4a-hydroxytetrahydrobiopterin dehydratase [Bdellovibrionota bacterium]|nr:4a-hydroxytetrahydrobiopterin dehydratase [Deltaproteobacteria bacterium]